MRSQAERAWARLMDSLEIRYLYEPTIWRTDRHGHYLPDFFIPAADAFLEVKGGHPSQIEIERAEDLMRASGKPVVFGYEQIMCAVFDGRLLPMGGMLLVPSAGRWVKVPLNAVGELVYGALGENSGLVFAEAARSRPAPGVELPSDRGELEAMMAQIRIPLNESVLVEQRVASRGEIAAGKAISAL